MKENDLDKLEKNQFEIEDFTEVPPSDIVAYNELRSCADLKRMYDGKQLNIQPDFQRDVVWSSSAQTRFIDSLVKQLPIPSMCISLDYKTNERLVIDGLQRINSIIAFLSKDDWKLSVLDDIDPKISGKTVAQIKMRNPEIFERVENLTIPITVLRCDYSKRAHLNFLFTIFHRLNTGGNKLSNQEIRNCIYSGPFNDFLKNSVRYKNYSLLMGVKENETYRFANEELILRFFAFYDCLSTYNGKLAKFLNDYINDNRYLVDSEIAKKRRLFERVVDLIYAKLFQSKPIPSFSKALTEALFIGIAKNIESLEKENHENLKIRFRVLIKDDNFSIENLKEGLSRKEKVLARLEKAIEIFA